MTDLTEQWKKGELAPMWYYVKYKDGRVGRALLMETPDYYGFYNNCDLNNDVEEVLAPVPTYQEYLESEAHCAVYSDRNKWLKEENAKLKGLLKECQEIIEWYKADCGYKDLPTESVLTKIDEVTK